METGDVLTPQASDAFVRLARTGDATAMGAVQARCWRAAYSGLIPDDVLDSLSAERLAPHWHAAVSNPPSASYAVLVACAGSAVVGFAAFSPSADRDAGPDDGEIVALEVDPAHQRAGHGSRLLAACADLLRKSGFEAMRIWCPASDDARRALLVSAGLRPDGANRTLRGPDGAEVTQERLSAALAS